MTKYIAILRGINVGGHRKILMKDLKELFIKNKLQNPVNYIQSGNVIFDTSLSAEKTETLITKIIKNKYNFDVPVIVRTKEEWNATFEGNPFLKIVGEEIERTHVTFLKDAPTKENIAIMEQINLKPDDFKIIGREVFLLVNGSYHKSKLTNGLFEKKLKVAATTRNWKTVAKLNQLINEA